MIVLIGFMGAGKTTVGRALADKLGLPFVDTDETIARAEGRPVRTIFEGDGEGRFRTLETEAVARALEGPESVLSVGGGAITDPTTCAALGWHTVVFLDVTYPEAMRRVGADPGRPLLHLKDPRALFDDRKAIYERLAMHRIDTTGCSINEVVDRIVEEASLGSPSGPARIVVDLGPRSYPILVGSDISSDVAHHVELSGAQQAFLVTHAHLADASKPLGDSLTTAGLAVTTLTVDEGEHSKSLAVAGGLLDEIARKRGSRSDLVVGFGGGVVCDLAGFVASTYHRGMPVLQVPTTLLAQVDAAIGGKTAVNLPVGKNLIGTFHQPLAVICDVALLRSLPDEEVRAGMAEVIKYGLIADPSLLDLLAAETEAVSARDEAVLAAIVRRSAAIKAAVVSADEREDGRREILNYGHTFGHAIEHTTGMRHGEAIAVGMMAAAHLACSLGMLEETAIERHRDSIEAAGLPTRAAVDIHDTLSALKQDKKHRDDLRFVLLEDIGSPRTGVVVAEADVVAALRSVSR